MHILQTVKKVPGGLMVVPLMLGALLNTIDQLHLPWIQQVVFALGTDRKANPNGEFLLIGGFFTPLFKTGVLALIGLFLFCASAQMNLRVGARALKKGLVLTISKYAIGVACGYTFYYFYGHNAGLLGLSALAIIAAMTNSNGGMYVALTSQYGNRSDVGGIAVLSLNDGPFFTMLALGLMGQELPIVAFLAVLIPIVLGMLLGNLDESLREFLKPGENLTIPFFAFALGANMNLGVFLNANVVAGGLLLGLATVLLTGFGGVLTLRLFRERSTIAGMAEGSTAGNAVQTPFLIVAAAAGTAAHPTFAAIEKTATAQILIACVTTAVLCPIAVILWSRYQQSHGIDGRLEPEDVREAQIHGVPVEAENVP